MRLVRQGLDNAALGNMTLRTSFDHTAQFFAQRLEANDSGLDLGKPRPCGAVSNLARLMRVVLQVEQRSNGFDVEAELACVANECQAINILLSVQPALTGRSRWSGQQADLLIESNSGNLDARGTGGFSNRNG
ncbi:hypothetical protein AU467_22400 [Mesorhizobium loti]|uniref:Uncharacterized protein n=1 Tax=Rhizobium loti TaxID=381 RepID=A0A124GGC2_RHILI|nr:hypothetical protein AU467_22400 [Mesorhizobium loti]